MLLLSACDSKDSHKVGVKDIRYYISLDIVSDQQNKVSYLGYSNIQLEAPNASLKLTNNDKFKLLLKGESVYGTNYNKPMYKDVQVCCEVSGELKTPLLQDDADFTIEAQFVRNNQVADSFKLPIPKVPAFEDIIDPNFVYSLKEGQDIEISWQTEQANFSLLDLQYKDSSGDSINTERCLNVEKTYFYIQPNQTAFTLPVGNIEDCGAEFTLIIGGYSEDISDKIETDLTHAPVSFSMTHTALVKLKVKFE